jgi:hypothetical protein
MDNLVNTIHFPRFKISRSHIFNSTLYTFIIRQRMVFIGGSVQKYVDNIQTYAGNIKRALTNSKMLGSARNRRGLINPAWAEFG